MRARSSFVIALVAWPLPLLAVSAVAAGRNVAAAAAWTGFVGLASWSVVRLLGVRTQSPRTASSAPVQRVEADEPIVADEPAAVRPPIVADERRVPAQHTVPDEHTVPAELIDAEQIDGEQIDAAQIEAEDGNDGEQIEAEDGNDAEQIHAEQIDAGEQLDEAGIADGLARLEAFANGVAFDQRHSGPSGRTADRQDQAGPN
jgi:hypothetical protein